MRDTDVAVLKERLSHIAKQVDDLHHTVCGNGKPGLIVRVDRLEQTHKSRGRLLWFLIAAVSGFITNTAASWLSK